MIPFPVIDKIRALAKNSYYQTVYSQAKEVRIKMFENETNLTYHQAVFINYLSFYNSLFIDVYTGEVYEKVLDNFIYEDAYSHYKKESRIQDTEKARKPKKPMSKDDNMNSFSWNFKTKKS